VIRYKRPLQDAHLSAPRAIRRVCAKTARDHCDSVLFWHAGFPSVAVMSSDLRQHLGRLGEDLALEHLERLGYRLVDRNYRTRFGELDLIVSDEATIVFVEVKARRVSASAGSAVEAVPPRKQRQVRGMAAAWLVERTDRPRSRDLRFDVVAVTVDDAGALLRLDHLEAAF
jgi:putative endonuclease